MGPVKGENDSGFWESLDLHALHEDLLASAGSRWDDWCRFNPEWISSPAADQFLARLLQYLQQDFEESNFFALKDPRICRLLPFWRQVLDRFSADIRVLLPIRNLPHRSGPAPSSASLRRRNAMSAPKAHMLWLRHVLDAEHSSRDLPRLIFSFDDLLADWRQVVARASKALALSWPKQSADVEAQIDAFLDSRLRHQIQDVASVLDNPTLPIWIKQTYKAMLQLASEPNCEEAIAQLDTVREEFDRADAALGSVVLGETRDFEGRFAELDSLSGRRTSSFHNTQSRVAQLEGAVERPWRSACAR